MNFSRYLVTGATGLLGSHIVEQLLAKGATVTALVRKESNTQLLKSWGVECRQGDIADKASLTEAMRGAEVVIHSAAKVGDWGKAAEFQQDTIEGSRNVASAALSAKVARFVHISSTSAYGHPPKGAGTIEESYTPNRKYWLWDHYTKAKVEAEDLLWQMHSKESLPLTIIRPGWMYGPRDRLSIRRIYNTLKRKGVVLIGRGTNRLNTVYAGSVAKGVLLACENPISLGQAYNVTNDGIITQKEWFAAWATAFGLSSPRWKVPYPVAYSLATGIESFYRLTRSAKAPFITRYATWLLGRDTIYSTKKIEHELGWSPMVTYQDGIAKAVAWFQAEDQAGRS